MKTPKFATAIKAAYIGATATLCGSYIQAALSRSPDPLPPSISSVSEIKPKSPPQPIRNEEFRITEFALLNERHSLSDDPARLNQLELRLNSVYDVKNASDLIVGMTFLAKGYVTNQAGETDLRGTIRFTRLDSGKFIEGPLHIVSDPKKWSQRPTIKDVGATEIINHFQLPPNNAHEAGIPYLTVLNGFEEQYVQTGKVEIRIEIRDHYSNQRHPASFSHTITINRF